jgi:HD-like signal output (HDOD) protein
MDITREATGTAEAEPVDETSTNLHKIIMTTRDLPAMPQVAGKVLELSSDPNTSAGSLQQVISDDQAMTGRILKIANSAMYSCSRKIKTLTEAIVMLGFNSIRSLVVTSAARNLYKTGNNSRSGLKERLLWEHSIGCAFACKLLVASRVPALAEEAFLAGLMHDIGKLVLNLRVPDVFDEIVQVVYNENKGFAETERRFLEFDHTHVGSLLVNKWKLSPLLEDVILEHHNEDAFTADKPLLLYLDLANRICHKVGVGFTESAELELVDCPSNKILGLSAEEIELAVETLQEALENEMDIFT